MRVAALLAAIFALASTPKLSLCPPQRSGVHADAGCSGDVVCNFDGGSWCACEPSSCVTAAGPVPGCKSVTRWVCRDDGCPRTPRGACEPEKRKCDYDDGLCSLEAECIHGQWKSAMPNCRP